MAFTLLIMAAGSGTRYGGLKQIEPVGPHGETIIDYSVFDAVRAGFDRVVFVIRKDIEEPVRRLFRQGLEKHVDVDYVFQDVQPATVQSPEIIGRQRPWGTAHAILVAADAIRESFGVINGDDFYGRESFLALGDHLRSSAAHSAMVGFVLRNTLSGFGPVKRGICSVSTDGFLDSVAEFEHIQRDGRAAAYKDESGVVHKLSGNEIVSMNMWCFRPAFFPALIDRWNDFLRYAARNESREFYIPDVVTFLIKQGSMKCQVLRTNESWFGLTYREDFADVVARIRRLIASGTYSERLWS